MVEIDWTPIAPNLASQRLNVYAAVGVPEVWTWERDGDGGHARIHVIVGSGYQERARSAMVPAVRVEDLNVVLNEADEERRMALTRDLARRIAEHWSDPSSP